MVDQKSEQEFEGFENVDDAYADPATDGVLLDDSIDDADFQDMDDAALDDVFEEDPQAAQAEPKKKVKWFNIILAIVAIVGAGGLGVSMFAPQLLSGGSAPTQIPADVAVDANSPANAEAAAQAALAPVPGAPAQGGMLDNPDAFANLADSAVPAPAPVQPANPIPDPFAALNKAQAPAADVAADVAALPDVPMPAPIAPEEAADVMPMSTETAPVVPAAPVESVSAEATPMPAAAAPLDVAANAAVVNSLQGQVDTLSNRMNSIESKLDAALAANSGTQSVAAPADDARFEAIQNVLARLESRLNDMSNTRSQRAEPVAIVDDGERPAPVRAKKAAPKAKKAMTVHDEPYKPARDTVVPAAAATANASGWSLRGAKPGQAIIGQAGGDVRQVSIGDSVPGIGQVTGIAPINGRWVVQGTQGRISQ